MNPLRRRLRSIGGFPADVRDVLAAESPIVLAERLRGSVTITFDTPILGTRRIGILGAFGVTAQRLVLHGNMKPLLSVPHLSSVLDQVEVGADRGHLDIAYRTPLDDGRPAARITVRLRTARARELAGAVPPDFPAPCPVAPRLGVPADWLEG